MPAPIAFNTGSQTAGTLKVARLEYSISSSIGSGSANLRWFPTVNPGPYGLVFATSNFTQSYGTYQASTPLFYTASNTVAGIISASNRLPDRYNQTQFTTTASALEWIASSGKYFMMNYEYPQIVSDKLVYLVDSTLLASYPQTSTTTYPIQNTPLVGVGTLQNGVAWDFTSRTFDFDGSDDQILINTSDRFGDLDWSQGITVMVLYKIDAVTDFNGQFRAFIGVTGGSRSFNYYLYGADNPATTLQYHFSALYSSGFSNSLTISADRYHLGIFTCDSSNAIYYHNGASIGTQGAGTPAYYTAGGPQYLGRADNFAKGNIARWALYNKALTQAEVLQNLYQGNIITDSISGSYQASNLVSYIPNDTKVYNLTSNIISGSLQNGVGYNSAFGGYWSFDGADDRILLEGSTTNAWTLPTTIDWTVNAWIRTTTTVAGLGQAPIFTNSNGGPVYSVMQLYSGYMAYYRYNNAWIAEVGETFVSDGKWHLLTWVNNSNQTMNFYIDGNFDVNVTSTTQTNNALDIIGASWAANYQGDIASLQINKGKAFTNSEVLQNFNAQRNQFGL